MKTESGENLKRTSDKSKIDSKDSSTPEKSEGHPSSTKQQEHQTDGKAHQESTNPKASPPETSDHRHESNENKSEATLQGQKVAVKLTNVNLRRGSTKILQNINMTILEGQIYGLLGPSGCGKTTLLKTILGLNKPTSGQVVVFNMKPGTKASIVPGPDVGFMPQDISLYLDFTVNETLNFFARVYGLSKAQRKERKDFMFKFLELPPAGRKIHQLSGGQRRRVSLAAALMQNPTFLILDEPTVGIDPVLRETIWKHLHHLTIQKKTTIIITTHYIEEAQRAGRIAFMRQGCLLAEEDPQTLMRVFQTPSLEVVFLKFCLAEGGKVAEFDSRGKIDWSKLPNATRKRTTFRYEAFSRIYALLIKGIVQTSRNLSSLVVQILQPGIQMVLFCYCFGKKPEGILIANYDQDEDYSKEFLGKLNSTYISLKNYETFNDSREAVENGKVWGFFYFNENYTEAVQENFNSPLMKWLKTNSFNFIFAIRNKITPQFDLEPAKYAKYTNQSTIEYYGDYSSYPMKIIITEQLVNATRSYTQEFLADEANTSFTEMIYAFTNAFIEVLTKEIKDPKIIYPLVVKVNETFQNLSSSVNIKESFSQPLVVDEAVYGNTNNDDSFLDYGAPGLIVCQAYVLAAALTALSLVIERKEGVLERGRIAGIKAYEFIFSHILLQFAVVIFQVICVLLVAYVIFNLTQMGSLFVVALLILLQGIVGMSYGLLVSSVCTDEITALTLIVGTYLPTLILSAVLWPIEAMPKYLRYFSYILPQTLPCQAMRSVTLRGWGLGHTQVWLSVVVVLIWTAIYNFFAVIFFTRM